MIFLHVSEMFIQGNDQKTIQYMVLNYLLETRVSKVCPSSYRNILSVISYGLINPLNIHFVYIAS